MARIFPQFADYMEALVSNRRMWNDALLHELAADPGKTVEEREAEAVRPCMHGAGGSPGNGEEEREAEATRPPTHHRTGFG